MGPADSHRITRVPRYSGFQWAPSVFAYRIVTFSDETFQTLLLHLKVPYYGPTTPHMHKVHMRFGLVPGRSPLLGESLLFSLPGGTKMFQFPPLASVSYIRISVLQTDGLSHSEIPGSKVICTYPRLIAAYHVLHRLCEPRHPPCALSYFLLISSEHKT